MAEYFISGLFIFTCFGRLFTVSCSALPRAEAEPSKDSFLRLLMKTKIVLLCYVTFTLSAGLGFLDATLSLFAIDTVKFHLLKIS